MQTKPLPYGNKGDLTTGPVKQHLIRLSLPMTWGIMAIISFQLVDTFFIAQLGTKPLAAISFTFPLTYIIFSIIMGFGIAMSSVVSRLIGEKRHEDVLRVVTHGLGLVFMLGLTITLAGIALHDRIFVLMGAEADLLPMIGDYMHIWFAGIVFLTVPMVGNAAIRANGNTATPAIIMTVAALANVILDPILIFGLLGFPRLELQGAAIATVIANACAMAAGLYVLGGREKLLSPRAAIAHIADFGDSVRRLLSIAVPVALTNTIQPVVNAFIISLLALHGTEAVAAFGVVTRIEAFAFVILMGVAVGLAPIIGQNWGARRFDRVHEALNLAIGFSVIWSLLIALVLGIFARPIAGLFSDDPQLIAYAALFFWIVPVSYAFSNLVNGWASAFNAMGMPQRSMLMIVVKMLILMIPGVYIGNMLGGVTGIFIAIALVNGAAGLFFHLWSWRTCMAREHNVIEKPAA